MAWRQGSGGPVPEATEPLLGFVLYCYQRLSLVTERLFPDLRTALHYQEEHQQRSVNPLCQDDFLVKLCRLHDVEGA